MDGPRRNLGNTTYSSRGDRRRWAETVTDDIAQCFSLVVHEVRFRIVAPPKAWPLPIKKRKKNA